MRTWSVLVIAAAVGCTSPQDDEQLSSTEQTTLSPGEYAAWVVWNQTTGLDFDRSYNSTALPAPGGGGLGVSEVPTGVYTVSIQNITSTAGNAQVTAIGTDNARCKVSNKSTFVGGINITVKCYSGAGILVHSGFSLSYALFSGGTSYSPQGAYLFMNQPSGTGALDSSQMWGDTATVSSGGTGVYVLTYANQTFTNGNLEVTAGGTVNGDYCKVRAFTTSTVTVACYVSGGTPTATTFSFRYTRGSTVCTPNGLHDSYVGSGAYAWLLGSTPPVLPVAYSYDYLYGGLSDCSCDHYGTNTPSRKTVGVFNVNHEFMCSGSATPPRQGYLATAIGNNSNYCKIHGISDTGAGCVSGRVEVWCYNNNGSTKVDTDFFDIVLSSLMSVSC